MYPAFFLSKLHEIQIYFRSYCVQNFHLVWQKSRYERLYVSLFLFVLFCNSFGSRPERSGALQLLIKMLIRLYVMWEGLVLLYRNFVSNQVESNRICERKCKLAVNGYFQHPLEKLFVLNFKVQPNCSKENYFTSKQ